MAEKTGKRSSQSQEEGNIPKEKKRKTRAMTHEEEDTSGTTNTPQSHSTKSKHKKNTKDRETHIIKDISTSEQKHRKKHKSSSRKLIDSENKSKAEENNRDNEKSESAEDTETDAITSKKKKKSFVPVDDRSSGAKSEKKVKKPKNAKKGKSDSDDDEGGTSTECKESVDRLCLDYIRTWKENREKWSFKKVRQVWLLQNMYDMDKVPDKDFEVMLEYMVELKGHARQVTAEKAEKLLADEKLSDEQEERARQVMQILA